ncbi:hypothetical protein DYB25_007787 [Aphanomyces astaci]|uniref:Uncharacterized protein n=1 Tax=Aphanomyces astaci TaxID=112090 RepID=A0A396ZXN9_APHAT|nr:hypothetical protein DYB25_007787 [Aphanomyces astaci]
MLHSRAIAKTREAREELMPDSPVNMPNSPSASRAKHFDRFSYAGGELAAEAKEVHDSASAQYEDVIEEEEEEEEGEDEDGDGDDDGPQTPQDTLDRFWARSSPVKSDEILEPDQLTL